MPLSRYPCRFLAVGLITAFVLVACQADDPTSPESSSLPARPGETELEFTVGPELLDCVGVGPMKCLVVNGELFYSPIEGFRHTEGYTYRLRVGQRDAFPGTEPPADASRFRYRLIEIETQTRTQ